MKKFALCAACAAALLCLALFFLPRIQGSREPAVYENFRLGTYVRAALYGASDAEARLAAADGLIVSLENLFSVNIPSSDVSRANAAEGAWTEISGETAALVEKSLALARFTGGAFNPALGTLTSLWRIGTPEARVPSDEEISAALEFTDYEKIELRREGEKFFLRMPRGMRLDLGAVAKGYVADRLRDMLEGCARGALIDLGGNLYFCGEPPRGGAWRAGLQHPDRPRGEYFAVVELSGASVVTSGPYERYFEKDGVRYHHIIDPATGRPARSGLASVTVVDEDSALADALCTALFVMGERHASEFLEKAAKIRAVLVTEDKRVIVTPAAKNIFRLTDGSFRLSDMGAGE